MVPGVAVAAKYGVKHGAKMAGFSNKAANRLASAAKVITILCAFDFLSIPIYAAVKKHCNEKKNADDDDDDDDDDDEKDRNKKKADRWTRIDADEYKSENKKKASSGFGKGPLLWKMMQFILESVLGVEGVQGMKGLQRKLEGIHRHWPKLKLALIVLIVAGAVGMLCVVVASIAVTVRLVVAFIASIVRLFSTIFTASL